MNHRNTEDCQSSPHPPLFRVIRVFRGSTQLTATPLGQIGGELRRITSNYANLSVWHNTENCRKSIPQSSLRRFCSHLQLRRNTSNYANPPSIRYPYPGTTAVPIFIQPRNTLNTRNESPKHRRLYVFTTPGVFRGSKPRDVQKPFARSPAIGVHRRHAITWPAHETPPPTE